MSNQISQLAELSPDSSETSAAQTSEGVPVIATDILGEATASDDLLASAVLDALTELLAAPETPEALADMDKLNLSDVLAGTDSTDPNLGAYLKVENVNGNTVISVDADGIGTEQAFAVVTLEGVTGLTLQQLLQNDSGIS